ncbi:uncharacterized protein LOC124805564 [Schistocerca piceifrons]|uniref:uncharacterized protein LOC124805564 n=1 Tax=Schistocerca piceifrons TaxID=274613 RepID=UPI001F5F94C1|nr:uncharacterized protein LOC124805564 [Schistocerca piceifrons]XP_047122097.1 uncharacterized protein LOC124805564 [Schistocerca piceifrons]
MKYCQMLPGTGTDIPVNENQDKNNLEESTNIVDNSFKELFQSLRQDQTPKQRRKRTKVNAQPGRSISDDDFEDMDGEDVTPSYSLYSDPSPCTSKQGKTKKNTGISISQGDYMVVKVYDKTSSF